MPKIISQERLLKDALRVLNNPLFISEIPLGACLSRIHDEHDGTCEGKISVIFSENNGDVLIRTDDPLRLLCFRDGIGGGQSPRVWNALRLLALAIKLDNEEGPNGG